jgi:signal transduction histidine kinase
VKERLSQLTLFYQVAQSMASTFDLDKVLDDTMQLATAVLDAAVSALALVDEETGDLVFEYASGEMGNVLRKQRTGLDEGIAGWVVTHGQPVLLNDAPSDPRFHPRADAITGLLTRSMVCVPIQIRGETIGVLQALNKRSGQGFDSEDLSLMITTANQAAINIENARLYQSVREDRDRILQAQETVRRQVARNLHDGTVQFLSAISMGIDHLERLLELKPEAARPEIESLRTLTRQATQQARLALFELRPLILETQGLVPALEAYVQQLEGNEAFGIHLEADVSLAEMEASVAGTIFAIVQEAVNNAKKHASARDVWLRVSAEGGWLKIVVEDNGDGFDAEAVEQEYDRRGSIGLLNMRERAELIDGQLTIETNPTPPHTGTRVILQMPVPGESG